MLSAYKLRTYISGGMMFDQNDSSNVDGQPDYSQIFDNSFGGSSAPAPGAPVGPINHGDFQGPSSAPAATDDVAAPDAPVDQSVKTSLPQQEDNELLGIKQDALHELAPLVGQLEQSAEEKFRTTMMMIQASDDHTLVKVAYDAAKQIDDEKVRAQALLDVVNEINYFTGQQNN